MEMGFWEKLQKEKKKKGEPIFVLAPLANVTDAAFRRIIAKYGKPDVMWTEFVSADGLFLRRGKSTENPLMRDLEFSEIERPIVAQFFTSKPEMMKRAAELAVKLGFDGVDINMGCPDSSVEKQGSGAAHIKNPKLARQIIKAAEEGAPNLPVSVKTRIGYNKNELEEWLPELLAENPAVVTIHARTRKEMSKVPAKWENVKKAVEIRNALKSKTLIFGNGDVYDLDDAYKKADETGADGIMLGRAIFGNPWLFSKNHKPISIKDKLNVMVEHTKLFEELLGDRPDRSGKSFSIMKKHFKSYVEGFTRAKELRIKLMETKNADQVEKIVKDYLENL